MMKKITFAFLLYLCVFHSSVFPQTKIPKVQSLLWEISGNGLTAPSYIYGTMHVKDRRIFNFADSVLIKLDQCQAFAMEVHPDSIIALMLSRYSMTDTLNRIKQLLSERDYNQVDAKVKKQLGISIEQMGTKDPVTLSFYLDQARKKKDDMPTFLDAYLFGIARNRGKTIMGVEDTREHFDALRGISEKDQKDMLLSKIDESGKDELFYEWMVGVYERQELDAVDSMVSYGTAYTPDFYMNLITLRNRKMADNIISIIQQKTLFAAVGAAHLPGNEGLITILRDKGYTLRPVVPVYTGLAAKFSNEKKTFPWYTFTSEKNAFTLDLPTQPYKIPLKTGTVMGGMDLYLLPDLATGTHYTFLSFLYPGKLQNPDHELVYDQMKSRFKATGYEVIKEKHITTNGLKGLELELESPGNTRIRYRVFFTGNDVILLGAGSSTEAIYSDDAERFFSSLKIQERVIAASYKTINSGRGAFAIEFPGTPQIDTIFSPNEGNEDIKICLYSYTDLVSSCVFMLRYYDYEAGMLIQVNDSALFSMYIEPLVTDLEGTLKDKHLLELDGFPGAEVDIIEKNNVNVRSQIFRRGNRQYSLYAYYPAGSEAKAAVDRFLSSFQFKDYEPETWNMEESSDRAFKVKVPSGLELSIDTVGYVYFPDRQIVFYNTISASSGQSYIVQRHIYSKYYSPAGKDEYFNKWYDNEAGYKDSVLSDTFLTVNGFPAREIIVSEEGNHVARKVRVIYTGSESYELKTHFPNRQKFIDRDRIFFDSFIPASSVKQEDMFASR